jgi:hypothetical protein
MILYKTKGGGNTSRQLWLRIDSTSRIAPDPHIFNVWAAVKINGVEYTEWSEEFMKAFKQNEVFEKLKS